MKNLLKTQEHVLAEPVTDQDHAIGPEAAPVTIVEYGDYECPSCGLVDEKVVSIVAYEVESLRAK